MQEKNFEYKPIRVLENSVVDCIAAGEVVDRPAHMIKELCENSLDAGADEITVDFKNGGRDVVIRDNGHGMLPQDLPLALARHGTSKITKADDLWLVSSYGFRGEALASIGAVSGLTITTRAKTQTLGHKISNEYGTPSDVTETGADYGTTIEVQNLFQNVPARLKFLKTDSGESSAIKNQLKALALANPRVSFRVLQNDELLYYWPRCESVHQRVEQVLEKSGLFVGEAQLEGFRCHAVVSSPNETVGNAKQIWLFVKGRHIQDRSLQTAVLEAYRNLLMHGEYPIAAIFIDCPAGELDVNVSPTKSQVKFREPGIAFRVVQRAVRGVLERAPWLNPLLQPKGSHQHFEIEHKNFEAEYPAPQNMNFQSHDFARTQYQVKDSTPTFQLNEVRAALQSLDLVDDRSLGGSDSRHQPATEKSRALWSHLEVIGQAHLTYIVAQKMDAVIFIDQHAAHERVLFEKIMSSYSNGTTEVQNFLLPHVVKVSEDFMPALLNARPELERLGLFLDALGPGEVAVQGAPALIKSEAIDQLIGQIGQEYAELGASFHIDKVLAHIVATMACHSAVRAGQALSKEEMVSLLKQMDEYPLSSFCPHGRPVYVDYPLRQLERDFGRIT